MSPSMFRRAAGFALTSMSLLVGTSLSASAQFPEEALILDPSFGGPQDTFTATYDINAGGCGAPDGKMVHFYWFGGGSSITVIGKVPLVRCVASLTATPPAGTPPGEYAVGADLFSPGGSQRPQHGAYRVDATARPRLAPSTSAPGGASSRAPAPGAGTSPPGGAAAGKRPTAPSSGAAPGVPGGGPNTGEGPAVPSSTETDEAGGSDSAGEVAGGDVSAAGPSGCGVQDVRCRTEAERSGQRRGLVRTGSISLLLAGVGLMAGSAWTRRRRRNGGEALSG